MHLRYNMDGFFSLSSDELEEFLIQWETFHYYMYKGIICNDFRCMATYLMIRKLYEFRLKVEKKSAVVKLVGYKKIKVTEIEGIEVFTIKGLTARRFKQGDYVAVVDDLPETVNRYRVKSVKFRETRAGVNYFSAELLFDKFYNKSQNN